LFLTLAETKMHGVRNKSVIGRERFVKVMEDTFR
jgi:hypothetical protein